MKRKSDSFFRFCLGTGCLGLGFILMSIYEFALKPLNFFAKEAVSIVFILVSAFSFVYCLINFGIYFYIIVKKGMREKKETQEKQTAIIDLEQVEKDIEQSSGQRDTHNKTR